MKIKSIRKALVAIVGVAVAFGLVDEESAQNAIAALTAFAVWLVPNE